jgi:hypothetical protein
MQDFDDDYLRLKAFLKLYNATYRDMSFLPPELRPEHLLAELEKEDPRRAVANVRTEVNRIVAESFRWSPSHMAHVEAELSARGIISLAALKERFQKEYKAIIERGELTDLVDYYMAKELVSDTRPATRHEREALEMMMADFEEAEVARRGMSGSASG